jgi:hypothetical protein
MTTRIVVLSDGRGSTAADTVPCSDDILFVTVFFSTLYYVKIPVDWDTYSGGPAEI